MVNIFKKYFTSFLLILLCPFISGFWGCEKDYISENYIFNLIGEKEEIAIGQGSLKKIELMFPPYEDSALTDYINKIGQKLASVSHRQNLPYHFTILDTHEVNAFALPGGFIFITRGALALINSETELACVLGHEIGHVAARHTVKTLSQLMAYQVLRIGSLFFLEDENVYKVSAFADAAIQMILLGHGREAEIQADELGVKYALQAGYSPEGMLKFLDSISMEFALNYLLVDDLFKTHPNPYERSEILKKKIEYLSKFEPKSQELFWKADEYKEKISGMILGRNPAVGNWDGQLYENKFFRFSFLVPFGFKLEKRKAGEIEIHPEDLDIQLKIEGSVCLGDFETSQLKEKVENEQNTKSQKAKQIMVENQPAILAFYSSAFREKNDNSLRARIFLTHDGIAYVFSRYGKVIDNEEFFFNQILRNFRFLSPDAKDLKIKRLEIYTVKEGDTWTTISENLLGDKNKKDLLARDNGFHSFESLYVEQKLKIPQDIDK